MRKLASIQKITAIYPIEGKDRIVLAQILGWQVIVKKDEFVVGDKCVYFEIDSLLPIEPRYEFLGKTTNYLGTKGYRLQTMKMAKVLSQGLALPLNLFPEINENFNVDDDLTELLNIIKYDKELIENSQRPGSILSGATAGNFPTFIPKTDQTRIQSLPMYFELYKNYMFEETLKLDGSSCTMYKVSYPQTGILARIKRLFGFKTTEIHFGICSRNLEIKRPEVSNRKSDFWDVAVKYQIEKYLPTGYAVQGEIIGPKIQGNWEKVKELEYYIFDVYDIEKQTYLLPEERREFVKINLPFAKHIPIVDTSIVILNLTQEQLLERVKGPSMNPNTVSEGRVYKSVDKPTISFKCISNDYLLKEK